MYGAQQKENLDKLRQEQNVVVPEKTRSPIDVDKFTEKINQYQ